MGKKYEQLNSALTTFIQQQKIFFVATAGTDTRVNLSPKGMDSLKVLSSQRVIWLNVTGSGNETAAHVLDMPRMTVMFCAFEGAPLILRLYGNASVYHPKDPEFQALIDHFEPIPGARQIFDLQIDLVQSSCGMAVPFFDYVDEREQLNRWAENLGEEGVQRYWEQKNQQTIDGNPTHILKDS